jgi:hypothetical protein
MSGTTSSASVVLNGTISDVASLAQTEAVQTSGTHVGTPSNDFTLAYGACTLSFRKAVPFIADTALYTALNASTVAVANIAWAN